MEYKPHTWVILKIHNVERNQKIYKVFAGWYGGYENGDSWKLNSGITRFVLNDFTVDFYGYSGSVYKCGLESEKMSMYQHSVLANFKKELTEAGNNSTIDVISFDDFIEEFLEE